MGVGCEKVECVSILTRWCVGEEELICIGPMMHWHER